MTRLIMADTDGGRVLEEEWAVYTQISARKSDMRLEIMFIQKRAEGTNNALRNSVSPFCHAVVDILGCASRYFDTVCGKRWGVRKLTCANSAIAVARRSGKSAIVVLRDSIGWASTCSILTTEIAAIAAALDYA